MVLPRTILIEIALIEVTEGLTGLRVEFAVQRVSLTRLRREVRTTNRSHTVVRISDRLTTDLCILSIDMDQTRRRVNEIAIITKSIGSRRRYCGSITLDSLEDHSLIRASTALSDRELRGGEILSKVSKVLTAMDGRAVITGVLGSLRHQLRSRIL